MLTLNLDSETARQLDELAYATGKTPADIVQEALHAYLEDLADTQAAQTVLRRLEQGEEGTLTLSELERRLGLEH